MQGDKFNTEATFFCPKLSFLARRNLASSLVGSGEMFSEHRGVLEVRVAN